MCCDASGPQEFKSCRPPRTSRQGVTVKFVELEAVPPAVVTLITPVTAPVGTVAVIWVSETTVNEALMPPKVTFVPPLKLFPVIVTNVPTGPLVGEKLVMEGRT